MPTEEQIHALQDALETITQYSDTELVSRKEWGTIKFDEADEDIEHAIQMASDLMSLPLEYLTDTAIQNITQHIPPVADHLKAIDNFDLDGDPKGKRTSLTTGLHSAMQTFHTQASPVIPYLAYKRGDIAENVSKLNKAVADAETALEDAETWVETKKGDIDKVVKAAREAAASAGVATFTEEFETEAGKLDTRSKDWLMGTGAFAVATIGAAIGFYFWPEVSANAGAWETLRNVVSKGAVIAVLFTGTVWCGRIYRALIHQATVNRHRALSLKTFQAFVEATEDAYVQDAVLMAATKTVFGTVPTGLVEQSGSQEGGVNFVEFGKSSGEKIVDAATESPS